MFNLFIILIGKLISKIFRELNMGDGSTWPGHIALNLNKNFIRQVLQGSRTKIIVIAGTNGKTTTAALIKTALKENGKKVFQNKSGANLLNGIASSLIINSNIKNVILSEAKNLGRSFGLKPQDDKKADILNQDFAIFEIDENALSQILEQIQPDYLVLLNLFRDQLDRYGEVNIVASKWTDAVNDLSNHTTLILNADDPQIAYLAKNTKTNSLYFGFNDLNHKNKMLQHAADSNFCPKCKEELTYKQITFSHLGNWHCGNCGLKRPKIDIENFPVYPLPGAYNKYNTHAAALLLKKVGLSRTNIENSFKDFKPAFGRQEILEYKDKKVQIFLSKNPTSFNQSFQTISDLDAKKLLILLNDRIPDGRDVSWIWDTELPGLNNFEQILISGDRVYDMALRLKYELGISDYESKVKVYENLKMAIDDGIESLDKNQTLFVLPTYSAMLDARKILTGKKIL